MAPYVVTEKSMEWWRWDLRDVRGFSTKDDEIGRWRFMESIMMDVAYVPTDRRRYGSNIDGVACASVEQTTMSRVDRKIMSDDVRVRISDAWYTGTPPSAWPHLVMMGSIGRLRMFKSLHALMDHVITPPLDAFCYLKDSTYMNKWMYVQPQLHRERGGYIFSGCAAIMKFCPIRIESLRQNDRDMAMVALDSYLARPHETLGHKGYGTPDPRFLVSDDAATLAL